MPAAFRSIFASKLAFPTTTIPDHEKPTLPIFSRKTNPSDSPSSLCLLSSSSKKFNLSANPIMQEEQQPRNKKFDAFGDDQGSEELQVAVKAVHMACLLCKEVQESLICRSGDGNEQVLSKNDASPVTIADWSVQAIVSWVLSQSFGSENVSIVAEEDVEELSKIGSTSLLNDVVDTVNKCLAKSPLFGIENLGRDLNAEEVLNAISRCNSIGGKSGKFWVLDPVDGTLGFVRGDQYAVALSLIEDGEPVIGVLGCPNYPMKKEWLSYHNGYRRILSRLTSTTTETPAEGCIIYAQKGSGKTWMQTLFQGKDAFTWPNFARQIQVSSIENPALATFCEPVEKANSSHSFTAGLAHSVGMRNEPLRLYSMVKYATIARGDAEIFMKFARAGYKEKIWDHAAGVVIIEEAGGMVTDAGGRALDFSRGIYLEGLDRGIIACAGPSLHEKILNAVDASWNCSSL